MRCAAHVDALVSVFTGTANPLTAGVITSSKIGTTSKILADYTAALGKNPLYQAWMAAAQSANRIVPHNIVGAPNSLSAISIDIRDYVAASYFSGSNISVDEKSFEATEKSALSNLGISMFDVNVALSGHIPGDNPIATINLDNNGTVDFDILTRYIIPEDHVVIYDKYIDTAGLEFVCHVAKTLRPSSHLKVFTTSLGKTCKRANAIAAAAKKSNAHVIVECNEVSTMFRQQTHDRYMFCGNRIQVVFSAGIGVFGIKNSAGQRVNKESKISVYEVPGTRTLKIEDVAGNLVEVCCLPADKY